MYNTVAHIVVFLSDRGLRTGYSVVRPGGSRQVVRGKDRIQQNHALGVFGNLSSDKPIPRESCEFCFRSIFETVLGQHVFNGLNQTALRGCTYNLLLYSPVLKDH